MPERKAQKGTVQVISFRDRLRLRWSFQGKRYTLSLELPDNATNRKLAEARAKVIEADLASEISGSGGVFDPTLAKYKSPHSKSSALLVVDLFDQYIEFKKRSIYPQSLTKYQGLKSLLAEYFPTKSASQVGEDDAEAFKDWLNKKLAPVTLRERVSLLNGCWNWALKRKLVTANPWGEMRVKVPRTQKKPFKLDEIQKIVEGFRTDADYSYYADYVEFLLCTGCRLGEAIALRWKHLNDDCTLVHFIESYYRGQFKGLKREDERWVQLTSRLSSLLLQRKPKGAKVDDLVFTSRRGLPISDQNFLKRAWKTVLSKQGIPYRKPRNMRISFASHALDLGLSPAEVSEITGHTQETLFRYYAGNVKSRPKLPDLLSNNPE